MPFLLSTLLFYRLDCLLGFYIYSFIFIIVSYDFIKKKNINKLFVVLLFFISILFNYIHFYIYPGSLNILLNFCFVSTLYFFLITKKFILSTSPDFKLVLENVKKDFILSINKYDNFIAANILANEKNTLKKIVKKKNN